MALVFRTDPEAPAQCALEIARALKDVHNRAANGLPADGQRSSRCEPAPEHCRGGINMAQRVMDCGDAGHPRSKHVAEDLNNNRWRRSP